MLAAYDRVGLRSCGLSADTSGAAINIHQCDCVLNHVLRAPFFSTPHASNKVTI